MPSSSAKSQMPRPSSVKFGPARPTRADVEVLLIQRVRGGGVPRELIIVAAVRHAVVPMHREASHTKSCLNTPNKAEPTKKPGTHPALRPERSPRTACDSLDQDLPDADNLLLGANDAGAQLEAVMEKQKQTVRKALNCVTLSGARLASPRGRACICVWRVRASGMREGGAGVGGCRVRDLGSLERLAERKATAMK